MENSCYSVYAHVNKSNGKMYIGVTGQPVSRRWGNGGNYKGCIAFERAIKKYGWDGFEHVIIRDHLTEADASILEHDLIEEHHTRNPLYGYNCRSGGYTGYDVSEETKDKLRRANLGKKYTSDETRKRRSAAVKSRAVIFNDLARRNAVIARSVEIDQYDANRVFVRRWDSVAEASRFLGCDHQNISRCLAGRSHTCAGSYWSYAGQPIKEPEADTKRILQIDPDTKTVIATYGSIKEAADATGILKGNISKVCLGQRTKAGGFEWRREIFEHEGE